LILPDNKDKVRSEVGKCHIPFPSIAEKRAGMDLKNHLIYFYVQQLFLFSFQKFYISNLYQASLRADCF